MFCSVAFLYINVIWPCRLLICLIAMIKIFLVTSEVARRLNTKSR